GVRPFEHGGFLEKGNVNPPGARLVGGKRNPVRRFPAEPLALADVEALRGVCSRRAPTGIRNRALLAMLFRSGLRISEALALFPKDIDPSSGMLRVLHGKGNRARTAPLTHRRCRRTGSLARVPEAPPPHRPSPLLHPEG